MTDEEYTPVPERMFAAIEMEQRVIYSEFLERDVIFDVLTGLDPAIKDKKPNKPALLLINDGQDLQTINFAATLARLISSRQVQPIMCIGIHCGADRLNEYGTVYCTDYKGRGARAGLYNKFIFEELLPFIKSEFNISSFSEKSFAGFSLGGLSALDIVWNHPHEFTKAGVFSGSLWWRRRRYEDEGYDDNKDRIMHLQVQKGRHFPRLKFFFECGRLDETADRNNNGVIDSIDDTTDLIRDLKRIGYREKQICYLELEDGEHNIQTWAKALPEFLMWGWGRDKV